ncbi:hypothetical protein [Sphingomonas sp. BK235]|uniref:hypothetical protein n=1 Tax=Sphingomonas sp. BK235 TaxID=2512131 RepID=UPI003260EABF
MLNIEGFYDKLLGFLDHVVDEAFLKPVHRGMLLASSDPAALLDLIGSYRVPSETKWIRSNER